MKNLKSIAVLIMIVFAFSISTNFVYAEKRNPVEEVQKNAEESRKAIDDVANKADTLGKVKEEAKEGYETVKQGTKKAADEMKKGSPMGTLYVVIIVFIGAIILILLLMALFGKKKKDGKKPNDKPKK